VQAGSGEWWHHLKAIATERRRQVTVRDTEWYCFGRALLGVESDDEDFAWRFSEIYSECAVEPPSNGTLPQVTLRVTTLASEPQWLAVSVTPVLPEGASFLRQLFPERRYQERTVTEQGWRVLAQAEEPDEPVLAVGPSEILVSRRHAWQHVVAMYAIGSAIWLQSDVFVLHAASIGMADKGVLLSGAKGAGKTTLALTFASLGHAFLGDEWAAVSELSGELLPLRRAASIRPGPHPNGLDEYLGANSCRMETLPDGTDRLRTRVGRVFPQAVAQAVPFTDICFLRGFSARPGIEPFAHRSGGLPPVSPLLATVWGHPPAERALSLLRTLARTRWWNVVVGGSPEETADMIEETVKETIWV